MRHRKIREESEVWCPTLRWTLLWFKWRKWLPSSTMTHKPSDLNFSQPVTFTSRMNYGPATGTLGQTDPCLRIHLVSGFWSSCCGPKADLVQSLNCMADLFWTLEWEECVCLGWTKDRPAASFFYQVLERQPNMFGASRMRVREHSWVPPKIGFPILGKCLTGMRFWSESNYLGGSVG